MRERASHVRCAIYTRKSSEEGLEQDFNSLHAQREACEAYVVSQKHEGWRLLATPYDDGGYSGGSTDRPGLKRLLVDIAAGLVDVVVVYKVDRLTRSLTDFAKIVEVFDKNGASFVSVTQAFNTTTSMGRLTLNVLLSFAQFEREVTSERIRDKIAASKKKGLWMGGFVPIGYEAAGRTLVINEAEADTIRTIYRRYLELRSVDTLKDELARGAFRTKLRPDRSGDMAGGRPFSRGHLYRLLSNPLYAGQISHGKEVYEGQHPAIIDRPTFDAVQALLAQNNYRQRVKSHCKNPSLLAGLMFDASGEKLVATHATKEGRRYRYYVSGLTRGRKERDAPCPIGTVQAPCWRLPAGEAESVVLRVIQEALRNHDWLMEAMTGVGATIDDRQALLDRAQQLAGVFDGDDALAKRGLLLTLIERIEITAGAIAIEVQPAALGIPAQRAGSTLRISRLIALRRRGLETRLIIEGGEPQEPVPDAVLIKALAQAHRWWTDLVEARFDTVRNLARGYDTDERYVARILPLAFISADLTRAVLDGRQPPELTLHAFLQGGYETSSHVPGQV